MCSLGSRTFDHDENRVESPIATKVGVYHLESNSKEQLSHWVLVDYYVTTPRQVRINLRSITPKCFRHLTLIIDFILMNALGDEEW